MIAALVVVAIAAALALFALGLLLGRRTAHWHTRQLTPIVLLTLERAVESVRAGRPNTAIQAIHSARDAVDKL